MCINLTQDFCFVTISDNKMNGVSPSGKALVFGTNMRWFDPSYPNFLQLSNLKLIKGPPVHCVD